MIAFSSVSTVVHHYTIQPPMVSEHINWQHFRLIWHYGTNWVLWKILWNHSWDWLAVHNRTEWTNLNLLSLWPREFWSFTIICYYAFPLTVDKIQPGLQNYIICQTCLINAGFWKTLKNLFTKATLDNFPPMSNIPWRKHLGQGWTSGTPQNS